METKKDNKDNTVKRIISYVVKSDRIDTVIQSAGFGVAFWGAVVSIFFSLVFVLASLIGLYLAGKALLVPIDLVGVHVGAGTQLFLVVSLGVAMYVSFEFFKTYMSNALIGSMTINGGLLLSSIVLMITGHFETISSFFDGLSGLEENLFYSGAVLFVLSHLIMVLDKRKSNEWYIVALVTGIVGIVSVTMFINVKTVDIVDSYEVTEFARSFETLGSIVDAKGDKSKEESNIDDYTTSIADKRAEIKSLNAESVRERKRLKKLNWTFSEDRNKALNNESWKYRTSKKRLERELKELRAEKNEQMKNFRASSSKLTETRAKEVAEFEATRKDNYSKGMYVAIGGELIVLFFIGVHMITHILNPSTKGHARVEEDSKETHHIDIKKELEREGYVKSNTTKVKDAIKGKL